VQFRQRRCLTSSGTTISSTESNIGNLSPIGIYRGPSAKCQHLVTVGLVIHRKTKMVRGIVLFAVPDMRWANACILSPSPKAFIDSIESRYKARTRRSAWTLAQGRHLVGVVIYDTTSRRDRDGQRSGKAQRQEKAQAGEVWRPEVRLCAKYVRQEIIGFIVPGTRSARYNVISSSRRRSLCRVRLHRKARTQDRQFLWQPSPHT
jgi:hypothetical protein